MDSEFTEKEKELWRTIKSCRHNVRLSPTNLNSEKTKFFDSLLSGGIYNPIFSYVQHVTEPMVIFKLKKLREYFEASTLEISSEYVKVVKRTLMWERILCSREPQVLYEMHGAPKPDLVFEAKELLVDPRGLEVEPDIVQPESAAKYFRKILKEYDFWDWKVDFFPLPSKVTVDSIASTIFINPSACFSERELLRLGVHEVGTHVLRAENGRNNIYSIFQHGFDGYIECEEGLAIYSEKLTELLSQRDINKYCLRVLACDTAGTGSFYDVYESIAGYCEPELAFSIVARVKRGLIDTSERFGYTKDQVYLSGFIKTSKLSKEQLKQLYIGKIGFDQICHGHETSVENFQVPDWVR